MQKAVQTNSSSQARAAARPSRAVRAIQTRQQLLLSAATIVGQYGYDEASIQRITSDAGIAQGTFYLHFESRQALFDELLPHFGKQMLEHVKERVHGAAAFLEVEERGLRAVIEYLDAHPWFWRVLTEARFKAPQAWEDHHAVIRSRYRAFLRRAKRRGELAAFASTEIDTLVSLLIAARDYLYSQTLAVAKRKPGAAESVIKTYMKFLRHGLASPAE